MNRRDGMKSGWPWCVWSYSKAAPMALAVQLPSWPWSYTGGHFERRSTFAVVHGDVDAFLVAADLAPPSVPTAGSRQRQRRCLAHPEVDLGGHWSHGVAVTGDGEHRAGASAR